MSDITYLNTNGTPMFTKGKCHAMTITLGYSYDGQNFVVKDVYEIPEEEQLFAEELQDSEVMGKIVRKGVEVLNLEMRALEQLFNYKMNKDAEASTE